MNLLQYLTLCLYLILKKEKCKATKTKELRCITVPTNLCLCSHSVLQSESLGFVFKCRHTDQVTNLFSLHWRVSLSSALTLLSELPKLLTVVGESRRFICSLVNADHFWFRLQNLSHTHAASFLFCISYPSDLDRNWFLARRETLLLQRSQRDANILCSLRGGKENGWHGQRVRRRTERAPSTLQRIRALPWADKFVLSGCFLSENLLQICCRVQGENQFQSSLSSVSAFVECISGSQCSLECIYVCVRCWVCVCLHWIKPSSTTAAGSQALD